MRRTRITKSEGDNGERNGRALVDCLSQLNRSLADIFTLVFFTRQGAAISSALTMGVTWCVFTAAGSLCQACFGSTAEGTTGRKRSVLLLTLATALALWFQYSVGPAIVTRSGFLWKCYSAIPGMGNWLYKSWHESCAERYDAADDDMALLQQCAGKAGVLRPMAVAALFFALQAAATKVQPSLNREAWPAKYCLYLLGVFCSFFMGNSPLFTGLFLWLARLGATLFVVLQQGRAHFRLSCFVAFPLLGTRGSLSEEPLTVCLTLLLVPSFSCSRLTVILIDIAYDWNEDWVDRADQEDRLSYGSGSSWLHAIVASCGAFYVLALTGIVMLYHYFTGCPENAWIITLTLLGIIAFTAIQLSGSEGSLLTSSVLALYAVYNAYSMVSKNPNGTCNPALGSNDAWGITAGLTLTAVSLAWTGFSWTAENRLSVEAIQTPRSVTGLNPRAETTVDLNAPFLDPEDAPTSGLVTDLGGSPSSPVGSDVWKLNLVLVTICCFVAMTLTGWGTVVEVDPATENLANPTAGRVNMAMLGISQWLAIGLYVWTLLAPRLFPDRDFA